jgi:adhesin transport system outer membrane protein
VINRAVVQSPAVSAGIEAVRAARVSVQVRESAFQPRLEARVRSGIGNDLDGVRDQKRDSSAELVLNWNLFNGGSDHARVRQQVNLLSQTEDLRDKACQDVRQTAAIAFNDTRKLTEQLGCWTATRWPSRRLVTLIANSSTSVSAVCSIC